MYNLNSINYLNNLIDSHCHFDFPEFDQDRIHVLARCAQNKLSHIMLPGVSVGQWTRLKTLADQYPKSCQHHPKIIFSVGLHPWFLHESHPLQQKIIEQPSCLLNAMQPFLNHEQCVAIGECGLDKLQAKTQADWEQQKNIFEAHCIAAKNARLPMIIHSVKTHSDILHILKKQNITQGIIHAFHGSAQQAKQFYDLGFLLGAGGGITYPRAKKTRDAFKQLPLDAIVLETDAPSMPIYGRQGKRNSPEYLLEIANTLALIKNIQLNEVISKTTHNAKVLFQL